MSHATGCTSKESVSLWCKHKILTTRWVSAEICGGFFFSFPSKSLAGTLSKTKNNVTLTTGVMSVQMEAPVLFTTSVNHIMTHRFVCEGKDEEQMKKKCWLLSLFYCSETAKAESPRVITVILPEQRHHFLLPLGYVLTSFLLLAFVVLIIVVIVRRRTTKGVKLTADFR